MYMVIILANLNADYNNSSLDKFFSLNESRTFPYWIDFEKAMYAKF